MIKKIKKVCSCEKWKVLLYWVCQGLSPLVLWIISPCNGNDLYISRINIYIYIWFDFTSKSSTRLVWKHIEEILVTLSFNLMMFVFKILSPFLHLMILDYKTLNACNLTFGATDFELKKFYVVELIWEFF